MRQITPDDPHALLTELCRRDFGAFFGKAWPHITAGELIQRNWHLEAVAYRLDQVAGGASRRLMVNLPPRNGKSKLISVIWVAFMLGLDPRLTFICVSYSNELSSKMARDCLSIMQSQWYREMFPWTIISPRRSATWDFDTTRGGGRFATSTSGTLTGRGADIIILDDLIKSDEAHSETARKSVNEWYRSTLTSRLNDKTAGSILCVMQRLHEDDLCGMLLEAGGWDHLSLPAIAPEAACIPLGKGNYHHRCEGDILHPQREPLEVLEQLKAEMGSAAFAAQYQQEPLPASGNLFRSDWLIYGEPDLASISHPKIAQSWDTANKTGEHNDYSVCVTALISGRTIHILHVWRGRLEFPDLKRKVIELAAAHQATTLLIEDAASGQQLIQSLRAEPHLTIPLPIARKAEHDKRSRAEGVTSMVEAGQVILPHNASWLADFTTELCAFPSGRHDDQVDAFSQLLGWVRQSSMYPDHPMSAPEVPAPYCYDGKVDYDVDYDDEFGEGGW